MKEHKNINEITPNIEINSVFLVNNATNLQARNGPFWKIELKDATGSIEAKLWSPQSLEFSQIPCGVFVEIFGKTSLYREQVQLSIDKMRILSPEESDTLDQSKYIASSPYDLNTMWQELEMLCKQELSHKPWNNFVFSVLKCPDMKKAFMTCPAAKAVHHAYRGGLLEHSLSVAKLALSLANHYPYLDRQVLLVGAIFHDLGKIWEFSYGLVTDYTTKGRLLGHMDLALEFLQPYLLKSGLEEDYIVHFKHLILSHHGEYAFGSSRLPHTAEAFLLHYADNIDAKMAQCKQLFNSFPPDQQGWSEYQRTLERHIYQPLRLPSNFEKSKDSKKVTDKDSDVGAQCSLL